MKNQWARDDPGFVLVILLNIIITCFSYCFAFGRMDQLFHLIFQHFFVYFLLVGGVVSFSLRYLIEKYYKNEDLTMNKIQSIEFFYAFDIHSNSFVPFYFLSWSLKFVLLFLLVNDTITSLIIGNSLYAAGCIMYVRVTVMGYFCKLM